MNCKQTDEYLDRMMDGELSEADSAALEAHCVSCAECAAKLAANRQLMRLFSETAPEIDVPLEVQAAWRKGVREEAQRMSRRRRLRWLSGIAAAVVVALGVTTALMARPSRNAMEKSAVLSTDAIEETFDAAMPLYEADNAMEEEILTAGESRAMPMREYGMTVEDLDRTCAYMADLVSEYEGEMDEQRLEADGRACANLYIDIPSQHAVEFLDAAAHYDKTGSTPEIDLNGETDGMVSMLLVLRSE